MAQEVRTVEQRTPATRESTRESTREAGQRTAPRPVFLPPADIYETKDSIVVLAEMPGVSPEGVDISLERRVLTIRGRSAANDHSGYQRVYNEYADGDYERVFTLSENIDRDRIEATLKDGILRVVLPKAEAAKARKIELKAS
jgi:HSP20 family molecular chaperone IbpA